jgi:hypothetical protein
MSLNLFGSRLTFLSHGPTKGRTPFGVFHNFDASHEEVGYLSVHLFSMLVQVLWERN